MFRWSAPGEGVRWQDGTLVFFDLETTGLSVSGCDIVQLSAISGTQEFNAHFLPRCSITRGASRVTGLQVCGDTLFQRDRPVPTTPLHPALRRFILFLRGFHQPLLVGHNAAHFDWPVLTRVLKEAGLLEEFLGVARGCLDTLRLSRDMFQLQSYSQPDLVWHFLGRDYHYHAHDALEDARTLQQLYRLWRPRPALVRTHTYFSPDQLNVF